MKDPRAIAAVQAEGKALIQMGTWLESTVIERDELLARARSSKEKIHYGDLLTLCSIKHWECSADLHKYKGRICFRGDQVKDEEGAFAIFQEMSSSPAAIQGVNATIAYGCFPGHTITVSDALRAYVQSLLKSKHKTWVHIPHALRPKHWNNKYKRPMCLLERALYGHPESGGHWQNHLTAAIIAAGGEAVEGHQSAFWFPKTRLLLTVYVDDLLLAGPSTEHDKLWHTLRHGSHPINLEDAEPLDKFLGRQHYML